ncbi:tetratricopeptide repeat protein, partial [Candidatus Poribacteria bacterium]|nr:tetratricopeptide repeat protein [Candidatus Poribacteria bacterium]
MAYDDSQILKRFRHQRFPFADLFICPFAHFYFLMSLIAVLAADLAGTVRVDAENRQAVLSYDEGMQALLRQDDEKALAAFQRAVALEPSLANAHYALGMLYKKQERWTEGVRAFQHAITADANYIEPYCELGGVYLEALAQVAEATLLLQKAIQVDPHHARARQLLGTAYLRQNRADAAIQELQRAVELNPSDTQALYLLGLAYLQQGKFDAASLRLKQTVEQNPFHAKAYFSLGNCYMRMGRAEEGQEALRTFE